jgi:amidohydrolase
MMTGIDFRAEAEAMRPALIARRRDLHQQPELAFEEVRTASVIAEVLTALGLEVQTGVGKTGVVGVLEGDQDGPTVLYRADMDALPIQEENDADYRSQTPGIMHACGHDGHVTIGLGVAQLLAQHRERIAGRVKFVFQPAEEIGAGALAMVRDGVLEQLRPDVVVGMHLWNPLPIGRIGVAEGAIMSGASIFQLLVKGKGGHGAIPFETIDPVVCAGQLIGALHSLVGRRLNTLDGAAVLSVTSVQTSSQAYNVIPEQVEIRGTFRTFDAASSQALGKHIEAVSDAMGRAHQCEVVTRITHQTKPVNNNPEVVARLRRTFADLMGEAALDSNARTMASEDMAFLMDDIPGMFVLLGSSNSARGLDYGHHHPRFDFDEDVLPLGVAVMAAAVAEYVIADAH